MQRMEELYQNDRPAFTRLAQQLCDSAFVALRKANNLDSVLRSIISTNHLNRDYEYASLLEGVEVAFQRNKYIVLYAKGQRYKGSDSSFQTKDGIRIGGSLEDIAGRNLVTALTVSNPLDYSLRITFSLHVDLRKRRATILRLMMPTFLLSLLSIFAVVLLFFITFRNWLRQKKLSEMKSDFINSITHEFHTPLSAIIVANKTMQKEQIISSRENLQPLIEVVQRQSDRLKTLISQVLDITTHNKIALSKEEFSIHLLLDEILLDYRLKLTGNNVWFSLHKDAEKDMVRLDRFWFTTILLNIFDNAVKYNNSDPKEITVATFDDKKAIYISIRDNGIGMTDDVKRQVFEKFFRHVRSHDGPVKGLGLGLFYVKQAVEAHNWKIDIVSGKQEGSTFIISIPF